MFVQIIEGRTADADGLKRQGEVWQSDLRPGARGFLGVTAGATSDGRSITIARFDSEAAARANSERPEQGAWWAETAKYYDGEVTFTESSDVQELLRCESDDAGFVQVMKISDVDRARMERLDHEISKVAEMRPDLLGVVRVWTGPTSCIDVNYFTSESEARAGERKEIPAELEGLMAEFQQLTANTEFLDITAPQLH
ncbi:MAG TPA: hypothetical protein VFH70_02825 [Acidimicrobiales bacterium]|nr:hypothetical protein [Acidimicrobiales bacterium]